MFNSKLKNDFPSSTKFFEAALSGASKKFGHAYMLTGTDPVAQYLIAINAAKILNCQNKNNTENIQNCNCINCTWINENRHPAVITMSPIDYTYGKEGSGKTVISVEQARYLKKELANSSDYHRVIILTDAVEGSEFTRKVENLTQDFQDILVPPSNEIGETSDRNWVPLPLTARVFQDSTANALLKILEEPGPNITFFFLTKDKEDMMNTIVSRCQVVPVTSKNIKRPDITILNEFVNDFPPKNPLEAIIASEKLINLSKEMDVPLDELLDSLQEFVRQLIDSNINNTSLVKKFVDYLKKIEQSRIEIINHVNPNSVLETLFLSLL